LDKRVDIHSALIQDVMTLNPTVAHAQMLAVEGLNLMQQRRINGLMLTDSTGHLVGALNMHDLLKAGVM
jgi:arabinose-5-phosphate isomerase